MTWAQESPEQLRGIPPIAMTYKAGSPTLSQDERAEAMSSYYASISFMDAQVGVLLDAMDRLHLWDRTVVLFQSDHGYHLGDHGGLWHKMTLFENGVRVPLIVAAPGGKSGVVSPRLVELVDLYPTLADLCGLTPPTDLEGTSFKPLLSDPNRAWKSGAFAVVGRRRDGEPVGSTKADALTREYMGRSVRNERYRYTEWPDGSAQLYDLDADPREQINLADHPDTAATCAELAKLLHAGWKAAGPK
jgi:uncharacterized sulfatase